MINESPIKVSKQTFFSFSALWRGTEADTRPSHKIRSTCIVTEDVAMALVDSIIDIVIDTNRAEGISK